MHITLSYHAKATAEWQNAQVYNWKIAEMSTPAYESNTCHINYNMDQYDLPSSSLGLGKKYVVEENIDIAWCRKCWLKHEWAAIIIV